MADKNDALKATNQKRKASDEVPNESKHHKSQDVSPGSRCHPNADPELLNMLPILPRDVKIGNFAMHRAKELADLTASVELSHGGGNKRVFQQLPRHMRRRTMSRKVKRVPRWLREQHKREIDKEKPSKRPSRRHRRRPQELLSEYNRRQRSFVWLETHIWHAKRFKMAEQWGYKIPVHPRDKSIRASYRAASTACLLQDISYYCCLQLSGTEQAIMSILKEMSSQAAGLTFGARAYLDGGREGNTVIYQRNSYPAGAIAPVRFLWRPTTLQASIADRQLWIWVHPAAHDNLLSALTEGFDMTELPGKAIPGSIQPNQGVDAEPKVAKRRKKKSKSTPAVDGGEALAKLAPKLATRKPTFSNGSVTLTILKDALVRLRLLGQMSTAVLASVLKVDIDMAELSASDESGGNVWWRSWNPKVQTEQACALNRLRSAPHSSSATPNSVIGLVVTDPRFNLSLDRRKFHCDVPAISSEEVDLAIPPVSASDSPLWDEGVRDSVLRSKISDLEINTMRSQALIPGTYFDVGSRDYRIPLLLIHQSGANLSQDLGHGWDLILPAGFAMAFWIPLIYHCARVGGCREQLALDRECQMLHFPDDYPDTSAGVVHEKEQRHQLIEKYFKFPSNKRPNFIKLAIAEPFAFPWQRLTREWIATLSASAPLPSTGEGAELIKVFVLRDVTVLRRLRLALKGKPASGVSDTQLTDLLADSCEWRRSLVCLRLRLTGRGQLSEYATVCLPTVDDLFNSRKHPVNGPDFAGPVEPLHPDTKRATRVALRDAKRKLKKSGKAANSLEQELAAVLDRSAEESFNELHAPDCDQLIHSADRTLIGYAKGGNFSLRQGHVTGLAFVSFVGLVQLLNRPISGDVRERQVLIRLAHSSQYRLATFSIP